MELVNFNGWPNCIKLKDDKVELIVTTDIGPRIVWLGFTGGQNLLYESTGRQRQKGRG